MKSAKKSASKMDNLSVNTELPMVTHINLMGVLPIIVSVNGKYAERCRLNPFVIILAI